MDWKNKYLKYKLKYIELKNLINKEKKTKQNILLGGADGLTPDEEQIFSQIYTTNLENGKWDKKTILLDCIGETKMQTETIKFINFLTDYKNISPTQKQLDMTLCFSVFNGYYLIVEKLINLGANPNINHNNKTLVDTAIDLYFYKTAKVLMNHGGLSKKYYSKEQFDSKINFSNDPENYIGQKYFDSNFNNQIYLLFREKMLEKGKFNFEDLSRNILKKKIKKMIKDNN